MLCVNSVQRRFQISDYKFFQSDTAPYESRKHSVAEISQQITTWPKCARTDYKHEGEKSEALEMCIRILLGPQKTCRQITQWEMLSPSMVWVRVTAVNPVKLERAEGDMAAKRAPVVSLCSQLAP